MLFAVAAGRFICFSLSEDRNSELQADRGISSVWADLHLIC